MNDDCAIVRYELEMFLKSHVTTLMILQRMTNDCLTSSGEMVRKHQEARRCSTLNVPRSDKDCSSVLS